MTVTAIPALADGRSPDAAPPRDRAAIAAHVSVAVALLFWAFALTHATGGRNPWSLTIAMPLALVALAAVRPWRVMSGRSLLLAAVVSAAPVLVCLLDPTHWFGASQAATYAYSATLFVTVRAYAGTSARRTAVLAIVLGAAVAQVAWSLIAWVGGGDPAAVMSGTFYWYNQYAAFLIAPAVIGVGVAAIGTGQLRLAGGVTAILSSAGVVLSTSRASMTLLVGGWLAAGVLAVLAGAGARNRVMTGLRWLGLAGTAALVTIALPGPPLFAHRISALASTSARNSQESVGQNGGFRLTFWKQAIAVFRHHPLTGAGFDSFGRASGLVDPQGAHSTLVHSGLLQPLSDGGLLLGVPFLLGCLLVGLGVARRVLPSAWRADQGVVTLTALGTLAIAVHSAVDFDWTYPSLMALAAILAGVTLSWSATEPAAPDEPVPTGARTTILGRLSCAALALAALVLAQQAVHGGWQLNAPAPHASGSHAFAPSASVPGEPAS